MTTTFRFCSIIAKHSTELANASKSPPVFSTTGAQLRLQVSVRFTRRAYLCNLIMTDVSTEASAIAICDEIMRNVPNSASTTTVWFAAPDAYSCDVTTQRLNGWILSFVFVSVWHRDYEAMRPVGFRASFLMLLSYQVFPFAFTRFLPPMLWAYESHRHRTVRRMVANRVVVNGIYYRESLGTTDKRKAKSLEQERIEQLKKRAPDPQKHSKSYGSMSIEAAG